MSDSFFSESCFKAALKLYCSIYSYRNNFYYQVSKKSKYWASAGWISSVEGYNSKSAVPFFPRLSNKAIRELLITGETHAHCGRKKLCIEFASLTYGQYTRSFAIDIDNKAGSLNPYHNIQTVHKIIEITKHIGTPVFLQSSYSGGWYLIWYLDSPVKTWDLAVYLKSLFIDNSFEIKDGQLEIYPNVKSNYNSRYHSLRLPCQKGSELLDIEEGRNVASWTDDPTLLLCHWAEEAEKKLVKVEETVLNKINILKNESIRRWYEDYSATKVQGITRYSETNTILMKIARGARYFEGINTVEELTTFLCNWIDESHNGVSTEYNQDREIAYKHCHRIAVMTMQNYKSAFETNVKEQKGTYHRAKSAMYQHEFKQALEKGKITLNMTVREIADITNISKSVVGRFKKGLLA